MKEKSCLNCGGLFVPERSTKKYCGDTCKQAAFYQRAATGSPAVMQGDKENEAPEPRAETIATLHRLPLNDNVLITSGTNQQRIFSDKKETVTLNDSAVALTEKYEGISSAFIEDIAYTVDDADQIIVMLMYPPTKWSSRESEAVTNINIRLRCLIENLLILNRQPLIPRKLIKDVSNAFTYMSASPTFKNLPQEYPYKELIGKLGKQCAGVTASIKKGSSFKLRLIVKSKVELISTRFIISCVTPLISFHDLDFTV